MMVVPYFLLPLSLFIKVVFLDRNTLLIYDFSAVIARFFGFLSASVLAVFIALSVWDEDVSII